MSCDDEGPDCPLPTMHNTTTVYQPSQFGELELLPAYHQYRFQTDYHYRPTPPRQLSSLEDGNTGLHLGGKAVQTRPAPPKAPPRSSHGNPWMSRWPDRSASIGKGISVFRPGGRPKQRSTASGRGRCSRGQFSSSNLQQPSGSHHEEEEEVLEVAAAPSLPPLLEPFVAAQELANQLNTKTWEVRYRRYARRASQTVSGEWGAAAGEPPVRPFITPMYASDGASDSAGSKNRVEELPENENELAVQQLFQSAFRHGSVEGESAIDADGVLSVDAESVVAVADRAAAGERTPQPAPENVGKTGLGSSIGNASIICASQVPRHQWVGMPEADTQQVAVIFSPSAGHCLDEPPPLSPSNPSGFARFTTCATTDRASDDFATTNSFSVSLTTKAWYQKMQWIVYQEQYDRSLIVQLALQTSPTRWYSDMLPVGAAGSAFRAKYGVIMTDDETLRRRVETAANRVMELITRQRKQVEVQRAWLPSHQNPTEDVLLSTPLHVEGIPEVARHDSLSRAKLAESSFAAAVAEKEKLFKEWTSLHRVLRATRALLDEEKAKRLALLGRFASCQHPTPCSCLQLDQEVLELSAVPLEPCVRPLCLFTSLVLQEHHGTLQRELLADYTAELALLKETFKLQFIALYVLDRYKTQEDRLFSKLMHYHQFCLEVARHAAEPVEEATKDVRHVEKREGSPPSPSHEGAGADETPSVMVDEDTDAMTPSVPLTPSCSKQPTAGDALMWKLRRRRMECCAEWDSPFFSYLLYVDLTIIEATHDDLRADAEAEEKKNRLELQRLASCSYAQTALIIAESEARHQIDVELELVCSQELCTAYADLVQAYHSELQEAERAAFTAACQEEQANFITMAECSKTNLFLSEFEQAKRSTARLYQDLLNFIVEHRTPEESAAVSQRWLLERALSAIIQQEQRIRDRIWMSEEPEALVTLLLASMQDELEMEERGAAASEADGGIALIGGNPGSDGHLISKELTASDALQHPCVHSSTLPEDGVNDIAKLNLKMEEDFDGFLSTNID